MNDGIWDMLPRGKMCEGAKKYWDFYNMVPGAGIYQREFGFFSLDKWIQDEGSLSPLTRIRFFNLILRGVWISEDWAGVRGDSSRYLTPFFWRIAAIMNWYRISPVEKCCISKAAGTDSYPNMWIIR